MMEQGIIAPTLNLDEVDERCSMIRHTTKLRESDIRIAAIQNFAFGGVNTSLLIKPIRMHFLKRIVDLLITLILWVYYIPGFLLFFSPLYLASFIFSPNREIAFQRLNHLYLRSFFFIVRALVPGLRISIQDAVTSIRSSVIVCNHLSYLDPILLVSLFKVPIFGWMLKTSGYIPSSVGGMASSGIIESMERMGDYLSSGGNLFIFPEGTRSRDGKLGRFNDGAFKIARRFGTPNSETVWNSHKSLAD